MSYGMQVNRGTHEPGKTPCPPERNYTPRALQLQLNNASFPVPTHAKPLELLQIPK